VAIDAWLHEVNGRDDVMLEEALFATPASGPEGRYANEIVIPFTRIRQARREGTPRAPRPVVRAYSPGSQWLYAKLYGSASCADDVLVDVSERVLAHAVSKEIDRFFFVRYHDPEPHLRLRFRGDPVTLWQDVRPLLERMLEPHRSAGRLWRVAYDTYVREVERYGGPGGIELAEKSFAEDSRAVISLLGTLDEIPGATDLRWKLALISVEQVIEDLGLADGGRLQFLDPAREHLLRDFHDDGRLAVELGKRFRTHRVDLEEFLAGKDARLEAFMPALRLRSASLRVLGDRLRELSRAGELQTDIASIGASIIHMHVNRMHRASQRVHELAIYDFLARIERGRQARARHLATP
jgi:thiopeptide-type bacteriocin biosynthesis protein